MELELTDEQYKILREKIGWSDRPWVQDLLKAFLEDILTDRAPGITLANLIEANTRQK